MDKYECCGGSIRLNLGHRATCVNFVRQENQCPDTGGCTHNCTVGCWRVSNCVPLGYAGFPKDKWPEDIVKSNRVSDGWL